MVNNLTPEQIANNVVINFLKYRPVRYTVHLSHDENGFSIQVMDVADDDESRLKVADALEYAASMIRDRHRANK